MKLLSRFSLTWNDDYVFNDEKILGTDNNRYWLLTSKNVYYAAYTNESSAYEAHLIHRVVSLSHTISESI